MFQQICSDVSGGGVGEGDVAAKIVTLVPAGLVLVGLWHHHQLRDRQCWRF